MPDATPNVPSEGAVLRAVRECAEDLTSIRDRTVILRGIVRRTRALLATDMSYLSLNDLAAGETFIHITDGVETEAYRTIRMPLGTGVLGAVAAGGAAVQTADYLDDAAMNHLSNIDAIVAGERVKAILGAPIRVSGRVVGALLVANRTRTVFGEEAIAAVTDLAAQAAVAFEQTRLASEIVRLSHEQATTQSQTRRRQDELESMLRLDDRLMGTLLAAAGLESIVDVLVEATGEPVTIYDPTGHVLAGTPVLDGERLHALDVRVAVDASRHGRAAVTVRDIDASLLVVTVSAGDEHLATMMTIEGADGGFRRSLLERASVFVSTLLLFERTVIDAENRAQSAIVDDVMRSDVGDDYGIQSRLSEYGLRDDTRALVLVCAIDRVQQHRALGTVRDAFASHRAIVSLHDAHVCVFDVHTSTATVEDVRSSVEQHLASRGVQALIGVAYAKGASSLREAHDEAAAVVETLRTLGAVGATADVTGLGLAGLVIGGARTENVAAIVDRFVGSLLDYDRAHGTSLCETAWAYLECGGKLTQVAARLQIHPNTVRQRAERIDSILGERWRRSPELVDTHFALRLWRLQERIQSR